LTIPEIVDKEEIKAICEFIADIDPSLPVCFLAFRPNFALDKHYGAPFKLMREALNIAKKTGLESANWSGMTSIEGDDTDKVMRNKKKLGEKYDLERAKTAAAFAYSLGCQTHPRSCGECENKHNCPVKGYQPSRRM
jgi:pyruvate formate lyase activating enzyme